MQPHIVTYISVRVCTFYTFMSFRRTRSSHKCRIQISRFYFSCFYLPLHEHLLRTLQHPYPQKSRTDHPTLWLGQSTNLLTLRSNLLDGCLRFCSTFLVFLEKNLEDFLMECDIPRSFCATAWCGVALVLFSLGLGQKSSLFECFP